LLRPPYWKGLRNEGSFQGVGDLGVPKVPVAGTSATGCFWCGTYLFSWKNEQVPRGT
jgi:hypothetical protein